MSAPDITIPRLDHEGESARAYAARCAYVTMGAGRSLAQLAAQYGKSTAYVRQLERWSSRYQWPEHARRWDDTVQGIATAQAAEQYLRDVEAHRQRYGQAGKALYTLAMHLLAEIYRQREQMECTPATLGTVARALVVAGDLEAHALRVQGLLDQLGADDES